MADQPPLISREQEQQQLLAIVQTWHPSALPEYRGFRCALCQAPINAAWHHWLESDAYHLPVHLCKERCEPLFQAGSLPLHQERSISGTRPLVSTLYPFPEETTQRFQEMVNAWPTGKEPELRPFTCDACGGELALEVGPDGSQHRQGYHVWWAMEPRATLAELHFHRACGQTLGIVNQEEMEPRHEQDQAPSAG